MSTREKLEEELRALDERRATVIGKLDKLIQRDNRAYGKLFEDGITLEKVMGLEWSTFGSGLNSKWYKEVSDWCAQQQHGTYNPETGENEGPAPLRGVYRDGYNPETNQVNFKVMLDQNIPLEEQLGLKLVLPLTKAHEGMKLFRIFRHDCSAAGSWYLLVQETVGGQSFEVWDHYNLRRRKLGDPLGTHAEAKFPDLMLALSYIYDRHPYERLRRENDDY